MLTQLVNYANEIVTKASVNSQAPAEYLFTIYALCYTIYASAAQK